MGVFGVACLAAAVVAVIWYLACRYDDADPYTLEDDEDEYFY